MLQSPDGQVFFAPGVTSVDSISDDVRIGHQQIRVAGYRVSLTANLCVGMIYRLI